MFCVNPKTWGKYPTSQNIFQLCVECVEQLRIWWDCLWQKFNPIIFGRGPILVEKWHEMAFGTFQLDHGSAEIFRSRSLFLKKQPLKN